MREDGFSSLGGCNLNRVQTRLVYQGVDTSEVKRNRSRNVVRDKDKRGREADRCSGQADAKTPVPDIMLPLWECNVVMTVGSHEWAIGFVEVLQKPKQK